ncbi:MAG: major structural phage protein [Phycisphaerales bacterium]|nr:major structural phage protein [Phycisphaerales bacterium]
MAVSLLDFANQSRSPMRRGIVQEITNESVFLKVLRFVPVDGFAYTYNRQTTLGGIAFRGLNDGYADDTGVVNPQVETLSIFGGEVRTDRQIVNKQGDAARANAIAAKVKKAGLFFDRYVIKGDPAADPLQFYGLNARLTGTQVLSPAANGGPLTLDLLDQALDQVAGSNARKIIVCNKTVRRQLSALVRGAAGGATVRDVGPQVPEYDGAAIHVLDEDGDEAPILAFDEAHGASASTTSLYVIRPGSEVDGEHVQGLIGSKMIEHVAVGLLGTFYSDLVESAMGLGMFHPRAACRVKGITEA